VTDVAKEYDVFLSYARVDDEQGAVTHLVEKIRTIYDHRTKQQLRVFFDRQDIQTAQLWEERIGSALRRSTLLVAVISDAYLSSRWCRSEWDHFASAERGLPGKNVGRWVFPVYLYGEPKPRKPAAVTQRWMRAIRSRQYVDLGDTSEESEAYNERLSRLTDDLIESLEHPDDAEPGDAVELDIEHHDMTTGYVKEGTHFVRLLAEAVNATIVGMTNENLASMLQEALAAKRRQLGDESAFWSSLRVVFLSDSLLKLVNDGRSEYPDPGYELTHRELASGFGRRSIEGFLKRSGSARWRLYESQFFPPFAGALLERPDGSRVVQLIVRRPQRWSPDHLYLEFEDQTDQYFAAAFEDIVHYSPEVNRVVPIGVPRNGGFLCVGARFLQNVLVDGSRQQGWLPTVLVVTWWNRNGRAEPVLQLRTEENSVREIERLSHLPGYVELGPYRTAPGQSATQPSEFELPLELVESAAANRIRMETGSTPPGELQFITTRKYLHHDKEHLFFYVYSFELPGHFQFPQRAQMCPLPVEKLLRIRKNQTVRNAIELAERGSPPNHMALEIVALNLTIHGLTDIADRLLRLSQNPGATLAGELEELRRIEKETRERQRTGAVEVEVRGLSGLQYREFFTMLLPLYSELGISGAADCLTQLLGDARSSQALERLAALYDDEDVIAGIPVEL
jgi:hypothetical protein